jgi:phage shock protein E
MHLMDWIISISFIALVVGFILFKRMSLVSPEAARKLLTEGALIIDVRSPEEFRSDHLKGVANIPLDTLEAVVPKRAPDKSKPLLLHCLSGTRSGMAKRTLASMGYTNVHNLGSLSRAREILSGT